MNTLMQWGRMGGVVMLSLVVFTGSGCAAFRARTADVDVEERRHLDSRYDYSDMRELSQGVADEMIASPILAGDEPPVLMIAGVQNRTSQYVDTKNLTDRIRSLLFQSGQARFVNEARREDLLREQGYQAQHVTPEQQVEIGRQLGAGYMISGSLTEMESRSPRQVRVSRTRINYYKLTFEVTHLESGEIVWLTERDFAREARLPLIGW